ncbi:MAG: hypothetical protein GEU93_06315 [Propionibacteriales bacterium]|nr:hypothetical protein [Propionibacteriales bacterium]
MSKQRGLLDVQELDFRTDQLAQRRRTLPELEEIGRLQEERAEAQGALVEARAEVEDLSREQRKADADVEQVKARRVRNQQRLDQGQVSSPKELEALQQEVESLERRIGTLEDEELEVMENLEHAQEQVTEFQSSIEALDASITDAEKRRDEAFAEIDRDAEEARAERDRIASGLSDDLLALYEKIRGSHGGVGAAALVRGRCGGCRLEINPADLSRMTLAAEDEVLRCDECTRILVRTAESGV